MTEQAAPRSPRVAPAPDAGTPIAAGRLSPARRRVDTAYTYLLQLFVAGVLLQVFLAGVGIFGIDAPTAEKAASFDPHRMTGNILGIVAVLLLVLALIARASRTTVIATFVLAVLTEVAQHGLAQAGNADKWFGGLHALDGMLILLGSVGLAVSARRRLGEH